MVHGVHYQSICGSPVVEIRNGVRHFVLRQPRMVLLACLLFVQKVMKTTLNSIANNFARIIAGINRFA